MPDQKNGVPVMDSLAENKNKTEETVTDTGNKILNSIREWYAKEAPLYPVDQVLLNKIIGICLSQYGAVLAVDCGVPKEIYLKQQEILFDTAYQAAPKFG